MFRLSRGLGPLLALLVAASQCLPVEQLEDRSPISLKLIQTLGKSEFASLDAFSARGVLAVRAHDVIQLWDPQTRTLKSSLTINGKLLDSFFTADGNTFITSTREKSSGLVTKLWNAQTGHLETTLSGLIVHGPTADAGGPESGTFPAYDCKPHLPGIPMSTEWCCLARTSMGLRFS